MIKKIITTLFFFVAVSVFSQQAKDQLGIPETIEFLGSKFILYKSSKNPDKTITQEYISYENLEKKAATKDSEEKLIIRFAALNEGNAKEPLEKKLEEIRKIKGSRDVITEQLDNNFYKISYSFPKNNSVEKNVSYFRLIEKDKGFDSYFFEFLGANKEKRIDFEIGFRKFVESFPNQ